MLGGRQMKMKKVLRVFNISAIVMTVAWLGYMFAPLPAYRTFLGATVTRKVRLLPPAEWGMSEECICGKKGGTHCAKFAFIERCVSTYSP
jgi:hypothetical protein